MAEIKASEEQVVFSVKAFLGLNENPDGDTKLKTGEFSELRNFCITRDRHLQTRPGTKTVISLVEAFQASNLSTETPVFCGAWFGRVGTDENGFDALLCAYGGAIWKVNLSALSAQKIGTCTQDKTSFFGFGGKVYLLNGHEYKAWDGTGDFEEVEGYIPLIQTATNPAGEGTLVENVNRLTGKRRVKFSPDGSATVFHLPEQSIDEVISVEGTTISYTVSAADGTLSFSSAPASGTNTVTVTYRKGAGARSEVEGMHFSELYNGSTDSRVFLYGDGTNKIIYSGLDNDGNPTAEYFPDLYEAQIGEANTPVTALIRHYGRLVVYKSGSAWYISQSFTTLEDGRTTAAFYVTPINRLIGNDAPCQVRILENDPISFDGHSLFQWKSNSYGTIKTSETNAKRISDRVANTLKSFDPLQTVTCNRKEYQEYWIVCNGTALILNYAVDAWYLYTNMPFYALLEVDGELYGFTAAGGIVHISRAYRNDDGAEIDAFGATGSMDFSRDWQTKYSTLLFIAMQPEPNASICVTARSNRRSDYPEKTVAYSFVTFSHLDFRHMSFRTNRHPQVKRLKLKVKKATFYQLVFFSNSASSTATVLQADVKLRFAGNVK